MTVLLAQLSKQMIMLLKRCRKPRRHDVPVRQQHLGIATEVVPAGVQCFAIRCACRGQHRSRQRATRPVLVHYATGEKSRSAVATVPVESRPHDGARVSGEVRPAILISVLPFLPVAARKQRHAPPL
jgi:hypothetical protein